MEFPGVAPAEITIFGGIQITETFFVAVCVTIGITIFALIVRFALLPRFKQVPTGFQNVMEMLISMIDRFTNGILGEYGKKIAAYIFTLGAFLFLSGMLDLVGLRIPATDLNFTVAIALITFVLIFVFGIRYRGIKGVVKSYAQPMVFIAPFRIISDVIIPVSLSFRLFGNMFAGLVVMHLVYNAMGVFAIGIPAALSVYFTLFDVSIQTFVFLMLTLSYIQEKVE
jgi:F-type H+-transporting ATPase subunit a